ncbi:MAG: metallophosphoesterase [Candidatus Hodarchaeota archaeon]
MDKYSGERIAVHISGLHLNRIESRERKVLQIFDELKPDFLFLIGDYIQWDGNHEIALSYLSRLKAKVRVLAAMGNYDYSRSRKSCLFLTWARKWKTHSTASGTIFEKFVGPSQSDARIHLDRGGWIQRQKSLFYLKRNCIPWGGKSRPSS